MKIQGAALINRFYIADGWTRELVADLLLEPKSREDKLEVVTLRYNREEPMTKVLDIIPSDGATPFYYAVYDHIGIGSKAVFDRKLVEEHEYIPFQLGDKVSDCDASFGQKNKWR